MKKHIENTINSLDSDFNYQMKWRFLKNEIRKFTISFSKNKAKPIRENKLNTEKQLQPLERKLNCNEAKDEYNVCKENVNVIYDEIANAIKILSRCNWYEFGEKSNKFFLNLEKYRASDNTTMKVIRVTQEITDHQKKTGIFFCSIRNFLKKD